MFVSSIGTLETLTAALVHWLYYCLLVFSLFLCACAAKYFSIQTHTKEYVSVII